MRQSSFANQSYASSTPTLLMLSVLVLLLATCVPAAAQSDEWQVFGGFSYLRAATSPQLQPFGLQHINAYGWDGAVTEYPWRWLGATLDVSGAYANPSITIPANYFGPGTPPTNTTINNAIHTSAYTMMFGPSFVPPFPPRRLFCLHPYMASNKPKPLWKADDQHARLAEVIAHLDEPAKDN